MEEPKFANDAKQIVDMLFSAKIFKEEISRDGMKEVEDFIDYCMTTRFSSHLKVKAMMEGIKKL